MMKKTGRSLLNLFNGSKLVLVCVFFTIATIMDIVLVSVSHGFEQYTTFAHLVVRLMVCAAPILPLALFNYFEKCSIWAIFIMHYAISCGLTILGVYVQSFFWELHPDAYRDQFISYTLIYVLVIAGALAVDLTRTAKANSALKKINS